MAKGPAGVLLPVLCLLVYVFVARRWTERGDAPTSFVWRLRVLSRFEATAGVLILLCVALPWFVAMYGRHGQPFTDRLLFHDMFKRAFTHVHDTNEGDDVSFRFYVWQLGYAMFPWTGLVPAGLLWWLKRPEPVAGSTSPSDAKSDASIFLAMWFVFAFALFSAMLTKFHHYILPALPPAAMLTGVVLDAMLARSQPEPGSAPRSLRDTVAYAASVGLGAAISVWGASRAFTRGGLLVGALGLIAGVAAIVSAAVLFGRGAPTARALPDDPDAAYRARFERVLLGAAGVAGALLVLAVGRDLSASVDGLPNQIRLVHLITYNYRRPWPPSLDFTPTLWAFTVAVVVAMLLLAVTRIRKHVVSALVALGITFGVWGLDVYFMKISPHWGQRETLVAYYAASREIPGPLIAYQMNWKGENLYTGNRVPAFVSSGKKFQDHILDEKKKGKRTFYFVTEHGRTGTLSNELGPTREFSKLTTPELNNKFVLVRARFE